MWDSFYFLEVLILTWKLIFEDQKRNNNNITKGCSNTLSWLKIDFVHGITIFERIWEDLFNKGLCTRNAMVKVIFVVI